MGREGQLGERENMRDMSCMSGKCVMGVKGIFWKWGIEEVLLRGGRGGRSVTGCPCTTDGCCIDVLEKIGTPTTPLWRPRMETGNGIFVVCQSVRRRWSEPPCASMNKKREERAEDSKTDETPQVTNPMLGVKKE